MKAIVDYFMNCTIEEFIVGVIIFSIVLVYVRDVLKD